MSRSLSVAIVVFCSTISPASSQDLPLPAAPPPPEINGVQHLLGERGERFAEALTAQKSGRIDEAMRPQCALPK